MKCCRLQISGVVQGVGFRPYGWTQAVQRGLGGWVRNTSSGVEIHIEGEETPVDGFLNCLRQGGPPLARVDAFRVEAAEAEGHRGFEIRASKPEAGAFLPVSPDIAVCDECLLEMRDRRDRRYRYPFINCTNCGPRFTIVADIPYDRPRTTMAGFAMCAKCADEYADPLDRRFHAQPIACPACGPGLWFEVGGARQATGEAGLEAARRALAGGEIVAVKGLGGFHLACDATNAQAVERLRARKQREEKPFALMAADLGTIASACHVTDAARILLQSPERPVVLLDRRPQSDVVATVAPGRHQLGFMLPYTPLHHLLLERAPGFPPALVMTSANRSDEPIAYEDDEARHRLGSIADAFLFHDRPIHVRCDDAVVSEFRGKSYFVRRSRGYTPLPLPLPVAAPPLLAVGGEMKNVFCLARDRQAFLGPHIGELQYLEAMRAFESGIAHFERLFRVAPQCVVHDLHPDYASTRYAQARAADLGVAALAVQHHHAHVAACMVDAGVGAEERVLGVAFDGTGYGTDGAIWGGEFLVATLTDFERVMHLAYCPLPGGDAAVRRPYRTALAWLHAAGVAWDERLPCVQAADPEERDVLRQQLQTGVNAPPTSSVGRLFDAMAAITGLCQRITYEAQAACVLESAATLVEKGAYPFAFEAGVIDPRLAVRAAAADVLKGVSPAQVAARFHNGIAHAVVEACRRMRAATGVQRVALSGGVWQNRLLLRHTVRHLEHAGFDVLVHQRVPTNDGGLALGQAAVAAARLQGASAPADIATTGV